LFPNPLYVKVVTLTVRFKCSLEKRLGSLSGGSADSMSLADLESSPTTPESGINNTITIRDSDDCLHELRWHKNIGT